MGMIGLGTWAQDSYLPYFLSKENGVEILALSECYPNKFGVELAGKFSIGRYYSNFKEMIQKERLDAIAVTTPHKYHFRQAKYALENGINVLLDKPLALRSKEAEELIRLAKKHRLALFVYVQRRYWDEYLYVHQAIATGKLGRIIAISATFSQMIYPDYFSGWRKQKNLSGGGILIDSGYHIMDIILWMTSLAPESVFATASYDSYANDAQVSLSLTLKGNVPVNCLIIRGMPTNTAQEEFTIYGTDGIIKLERNKLFGKRSLNLFHLDSRGNLIKSIKLQNCISDLTSPAKDFLYAIRTGKKPVSGCEDALVVISVLEAAYKSIRLRKIERLDHLQNYKYG